MVEGHQRRSGCFFCTTIRRFYLLLQSSPICTSNMGTSRTIVILISRIILGPTAIYLSEIDEPAISSNECHVNTRRVGVSLNVLPRLLPLSFSNSCIDILQTSSRMRSITVIFGNCSADSVSYCFSCFYWTWVLHESDRLSYRVDLSIVWL